MGKFKCASCGKEEEADAAPECCGAPMGGCESCEAPAEEASEAPAEGGEEAPAEEKPAEE